MASLLFVGCYGGGISRVEVAAGGPSLGPQNAPTYLKQEAMALGLDSAQFDACLDSGKYTSRVQEDIQAGEKAGVSGTPTFFINGRMLLGAQPFEAFKKIIDEEL